MFWNNALVCIDIGSSAIKVLEFSSKKEFMLKSVGVEVIPEGAVMDGLIQDVPLVEDTLKALLKKMKISLLGRRAAICLGGSSVIVKKVNFPNKNDYELADLIEGEAEQHFQHDLSELYFTWHAYDVHPDDAERTIILAGAKKELVEQHISIVKAVGLRIGVVDCNVFANFNMFESIFGVSDGLVALINVGASVTQVSLIAHGQFIYNRDISIGGWTYSRNIAKSLQISQDNAEAVKISASLGEEPPSQDVETELMRLNEQLISEIQVTLDFFFQSKDAPIDVSDLSAVFLTGGASHTYGLGDLMGESMGVPCTIIDPFERIELHEKLDPDSIHAQSHLYGLCMGLSLRRFNDHI